MHAWPIPGGSILKGFWLEHSVVTNRAFKLIEALYYGVSAYIVPIPDPDTTVTPDTLWDEMIPKDTWVGDGVLDLDTASADTTPEFELGELDVSDFIKITTSPVQVFSRREMVTFPKMPIGFHMDPEDPGTQQLWQPTDYYKVRSNRSATVKHPSYLVVGMSQPDYAATSAAWPALQSLPEWMMMKYLSETMVEMWKAVTGSINTGTQEDAFEAALLIQQYMEHFHEAAGGAWGGSTQDGFRSFSKMTLDLRVTGTFGNVTMGSEL